MVVVPAWGENRLGTQAGGRSSGSSVAACRIGVSLDAGRSASKRRWKTWELLAKRSAVISSAGAVASTLLPVVILTRTGRR